MKKIKILLVTTILVSMFTLLTSPLQVVAQKTDPESVLRGIFDALSAGDVDRAMTFVAENAVSILIPPPPGSTGVIIGKDKFRERYIQYVANHEYSELSNVEVRGDEVTCSSTVSSDEFRTLGLASLNFIGYAVVRDGLLRTYTWTITRESLARLESAIALETKKEEVIASKVEDLVGIWESQYMGAVAYMQFEADGTFNLASTIEKLKTDPIAYGTFWFEGTVFNTKDNLAPKCSYEVRVQKEGDRPIHLSFTVIDEPHPPRAQDLTKGMTWVEP
jgi:hypothetical protein